jgi:hypothetical protein
VVARERFLERMGAPARIPASTNAARSGDGPSSLDFGVDPLLDATIQHVCANSAVGIALQYRRLELLRQTVGSVDSTMSMELQPAWTRRVRKLQQASELPGSLHHAAVV